MIVAGFGFRASATVDSLHSAFSAAGGRADALASAEDKTMTDVFQDFATALGLPVMPVPQSDLTHQTTETQSEASRSARGTGSVAEAAALSAAGPGATLLAPRVLSTDRLATCALAERIHP